MLTVHIQDAKLREEHADSMLNLGTSQQTFLLKMKDLIDDFAIQMPAVTMQYENLVLEEDALMGSTSSIPTVGGTLVNLLLRIMCLKGSEKTRPLKILNNISGVLRPGRMTLLLGPPSCGKTSLMKLLAGRLKKNPRTKISGTIKYNGISSDEFIIERSINFTEQYDNHNANLTVLETMMYAFICQNGSKPHSSTGIIHQFHLPREILKAKQEREAGTSEGQVDIQLSNLEAGSKASTSEAIDNVLNTMLKSWGTGMRVELLMKMMGIHHCKDVLVGDQMTRGVSGGEKKRLTTAEMATASRPVFFMDEISTGLDSATLFSTIKWFSQSTHTLQNNTIISLLQPPPETFQLFDDVIMIAEGIVFYHGPVEDALPFFAELGFDCPSRKDVPSFLLEIATPAGQMMYANEEFRKRYGLHRFSSGDQSSPLSRSSKVREQFMSVHEISQKFWSENKHGRAMRELLSKPLDPSTCHPLSLERKHRYALTPLQSILVTTQRQLTLMMRDKVLLNGRMVQTVVLGLITGSLFYKLPITFEGSRSYFGASFMTVLFLTFGGFPQMPMTLLMKQTFFKHRDNRFIPAYAQGLAIAIQIPISVREPSSYLPSQHD